MRCLSESIRTFFDCANDPHKIKTIFSKLLLMTDMTLSVKIPIQSFDAREALISPPLKLYLIKKLLVWPNLLNFHHDNFIFFQYHFLIL